MGREGKLGWCRPWSQWGARSCSFGAPGCVADCGPGRCSCVYLTTAGTKTCFENFRTWMMSTVSPWWGPPPRPQDSPWATHQPLSISQPPPATPCPPSQTPGLIGGSLALPGGKASRPHGLQPTRLLCPWDFPGKSTGVGCHCLLRSHYPTSLLISVLRGK